LVPNAAPAAPFAAEIVMPAGVLADLPPASAGWGFGPAPWLYLAASIPAATAMHASTASMTRTYDSIRLAWWPG
jgi:hypothetical protein